MFKVFAVFAVVVTPMVAQPLGMGLKVGFPLNDVLRTGLSTTNPVKYVTDAKNTLIGPYIEFHLPGGLGIEADALHRSYSYQQTTTAPIALGASSVGAWEFPVTLKVRFASGVFRPFVEGGVTYGRITDITNIVNDIQHKSNFGLVGGGGIEIKLGPLRISPSARYTGWTVKSLQNPAGLLETNRSLWNVMVGVGF